AAALGTARRVIAVTGTRGLTRADLVANTAVPAIEVDPADGTVTLGGRVLAAEPVDEVRLSRRYLLS
ncbi:MAG: urease subunit alpha, partial [Actinobacteria bacterium]|nr:urease subunit alpha [Actinomycetota bacterium]